MARLPCKDYLKGTCTTPFRDKWHPEKCLFYKSEKGCRFGEKCSYAHCQVDEQPSKKSQKNGDKSELAILKNTRQLVLRIFRIWSRRSLQRFCERTYGNQSDVFDSMKPSYIILTFETKIHRSDIFAQVIFISATPNPPNLRIGSRRDGMARA